MANTELKFLKLQRQFILSYEDVRSTFGTLRWHDGKILDGAITHLHGNHNMIVYWRLSINQWNSNHVSRATNRHDAVGLCASLTLTTVRCQFRTRDMTLWGNRPISIPHRYHNSPLKWFWKVPTVFNLIFSSLLRRVDCETRPREFNPRRCC